MSLCFFPFMDGIDYTSYKSFIKKISKERKRMLNPDMELMEKEPVLINVMDIDNVPNGKFDTVFQGIYFECFAFIKKEAPIYVMLGGANEKNFTAFSRWSYYTFSLGSVLCIADPMLKMYDNLKLGWYYGNNEYNLRYIIADLVKRIAKILEVDENNIVFIGSSGGGCNGI